MHSGRLSEYTLARNLGVTTGPDKGNNDGGDGNSDGDGDGGSGEGY